MKIALDREKQKQKIDREEFRTAEVQILCT